MYNINLLCSRSALARLAAQPGSAFVRRRGQDLEHIFSVQQERTVNRDNTVQIGNRLLQIEKRPWRDTLAGCRVTVYEHRDSTVSIGYGPHVVGRFNAEGSLVEDVEASAHDWLLALMSAPARSRTSIGLRLLMRTPAHRRTFIFRCPLTRPV
jgi:hypothetical protein